jgi:hypothetical protein
MRADLVLAIVAALRAAFRPFPLDNGPLPRTRTPSH